MEGGLFLLLCLLALMIGSRARRSRTKQLSEKELRRKEMMLQFMRWAATLVIGVILLAYIPFLISEIQIASDTHFDLDVGLALVLFVFGVFTEFTVIRAIRKSRMSR